MTFNKTYGGGFKFRGLDRKKFCVSKNQDSDRSKQGKNGKDRSGFLGGFSSFNHDKNGEDRSGFLGGSSNSNHGKNGKDRSGFLGGFSSFNHDKNGEDRSGFLGGSSNSNGNGLSPANNRVIMGTDCNDILYGGHCGKDTLVGTTEVGRGMGEHDTLIGGRAQDTFVLGDTYGSYYLGGGNSDYATIQQFDLKKDIIQLTGSAQDYSISYSQGIASLYHHSSAGCDLVAQIDSPCTGLDLNANYFNYVTPAYVTPTYGNL